LLVVEVVIPQEHLVLVAAQVQVVLVLVVLSVVLQ
jgi:hypothetical protein